MMFWAWQWWQIEAADPPGVYHTLNCEFKPLVGVTHG
jgi:hypothetical protein